MLKFLWHDRTFRTQILIAVGVINVLALVIAGIIAVVNARNATRIEIEASLELAKQFVRATLQAIEPGGGVEAPSKIDQLSSRLKLANLRHVRIFVADASGDLVPISPRPDATADPTKPKPAPSWFTALVEPSVAPRELSVALADPNGGAVVIVEQSGDAVSKVWNLGTVVIAGAPEDEIAEIWQDVSSVALVWVSLDVLILAVLYFVFGRMLDPLAGLARGMLKLEDGHYATRLQQPNVKELAAIADGFNQLAVALDRSRAENARLYGQLISVQEDERREIANELHDEASPCLFGIMANTLSIQKLSSDRKDCKSQEIQAHVTEVLKITDHLNLLNRGLLKKLRPVALGRVALSDVLDDLAGELQRRHPRVKLLHSLKLRAPTYGEVVDLTMYRSIQEGVTNAIRHGNASTVEIELLEKRAAGNGHSVINQQTLQLRIRDDGRGVLPGPMIGFGTTVMRERVHALGGTFTLESAQPHGTALRIDIPIHKATPKPLSVTELVHAS